MALRVVRQSLNMPGKRKHPDDAENEVLSSKRPRDAVHTPTPAFTIPLSAQVHQSLIAELSPRYDIKTLSVISSTNISKRVDSVLKHLGRISAWDLSVLPGVVLLYARASSTNKLITIAETVRRRIHEAEQKWYQYNGLYETECAAKAKHQQHSRRRERQQPQDEKIETMIEDTVIPLDGEVQGERDPEDDDDDFEVMATPGQGQTVFERAVDGEEKARQMVHMCIILSRVSVPELKAKEVFAVQSNEDHIDYIQKKRSGLVG